MEDDKFNPRRAKVDTPRLPSTVNIQDLIKIIDEIKPPMSIAIRRKISEVFFSFTTKHLGVHQNLLQCGVLIVTDERGNPMLDSDGKELKKQYFYAGNHILKEKVKVKYEELPQQDKMLYDVVITEVYS